MTKPKSSYVISYNDVTSLNFDTYFPEIMKKISNASHVAVDLEFTSLGNVRSVDMNHRYVAMKQTVESAAIASIGLSIVRNVGSKIQITSSQSDLTSGSCSLPDLQIFPNTALPNLDGSCFLPDLTAEQDNKTNDKQLAQKYVCDNYNLLTLKQGNINIQSSTGTFLCNHGYSFDALFTQGIPFTPPGDITKNTQDKRLNNLWKKIMTAMRLHNTPLILHNGLYDMVYLYHSFIDQLPDTFGRFLVQVSEHFPSGLYDTRYLADKADFDATFLAYVFSKSDRLRQNRFQNSTEQEPYFEVQVNQPMLAKKILGVKRKRILEQDEDKKTSYCRPYAVKKNKKFNIWTLDKQLIFFSG